MKLRIRILWILACAAMLTASSLQGSEEGKVSLNGKILDISFVSPLPTYHGKKTFPATHIWATGEQFEFGMNDKYGPIYVRVGVKKLPRPKQLNSEETFQNELKEKQETYTHPIGKVVKIVEMGDQKIPIMSFSQVAGDQTEATVYSNGYSISFYLMQEGSYKRGGYGLYMEQIIKSLTIKKK